MGQDGAKMEPRWSQDGLRWSEDEPKWSQDGAVWTYFGVRKEYSMRFSEILKNFEKHCKVLQKSRFGGSENHEN